MSEIRIVMISALFKRLLESDQILVIVRRRNNVSIATSVPVPNYA